MGDQDPEYVTACWQEVLKSWSLSEHIVPITGAGVGVNFNLPDWNRLTLALCDVLQKLGDTQVASVRAEADLLLRMFRATHRLRRLMSDDPKKVTETISQTLYTDVQVTENGVLWLECVYKLAKGSRLYMTFNFDDLLEKYADAVYSDTVVPIALQRVPRKKEGQIDAYHLHGILPLSGAPAQAFAPLVFDLISYVEAYTHFVDQMSVPLLNVMTNYKCVFLGLSMVDPNLLRLLKMAYELRNDGTCWGIAFGKILPEIQHVLKQWGVATANISLETNDDFCKIPQGILSALQTVDPVDVQDRLKKFQRSFSAV
jgi:hypothetical protein